jgi:hypothetical protein
VDKGTGAGEQPRAMGAWLGGYWPKSIDADRWDEVRPFVLDAAERLGLDGGAGAQRAVRVLARLAAWAAGQGLPLDLEVVLDPDTVERFVVVGLTDDRSRATYRAVLRRVGPLLTRRAPWEVRPAPAARRQVAVPYPLHELESLRSDALVQPTPGRVRAARALLALGAGAGLDGRWVTRIGAPDVRRSGGVVVVRVGEPCPRVVPVLASWEGAVLELAASAGREFLVGGRSLAKNRASSLAASLVVGNGHPRFSASRLRSTWLVSHLLLGTRLPELAAAAGLQGVTVLSDLLPHVSKLSDAEAFAMLRGAR